MVCTLFPSFVGLGAPHWDPYVRGMIAGIRGCQEAAHLVRATLEAIVYQTKEVVDVMAADAQIPGGAESGWGASVNNFICQFSGYDHSYRTTTSGL